MLLLGVNIDHVATVRQARRTNEPDPIHAAVLAELGGADQITVHLREDRRHIQDRDVRILREILKVRLNLEMSLAEPIMDFALSVKPDQVCIVPERREEVTTEGGLDVVRHGRRIETMIERFSEEGIEVSLFIDPEPRQIERSIELGADAVEFHTGRYANAVTAAQAAKAIRELQEGAALFASHMLREQRLASRLKPATDLEATESGEPTYFIDLGHGLTYRNLARLLRELLPNPLVRTMNIGHSIMARAMYVGMTQAVRDMQAVIERAEADAVRTEMLWRGSDSSGFDDGRAAHSPGRKFGDDELFDGDDERSFDDDEE